MNAQLRSRITSDLPNLPDEVLDSWILTEAENRGWPPSNQNNWRYLTRPEHRENILAHWQSMTWSLETLALCPVRLLHPRSVSDFQWMIQDVFLGIPHEYARKLDSKTRVERAMSHLESAGSFYDPPILFFNEDRYEVLDGNHRIVAYLYLIGALRKIIPQSVPNPKVTLEQKCWVAKKGN